MQLLFLICGGFWQCGVARRAYPVSAILALQHCSRSLIRHFSPISSLMWAKAAGPLPLPSTAALSTEVFVLPCKCPAVCIF